MALDGTVGHLCEPSQLTILAFIKRLLTGKGFIQSPL